MVTTQDLLNYLCLLKYEYLFNLKLFLFLGSVRYL